MRTGELTKKGISAYDRGVVSINDVVDENITLKTINNQSLLGEGNIVIDAGTTLEAGDNITIIGDVISAEVPTSTSELTNDSNFVVDAEYVHIDNNFTDAEKAKLASLENYDDTGILADIADLDDNKVDKVVGKGLSTNDYTTLEKDKLASLSNYDDTAVRNLITAEANTRLANDETLQDNIDLKQNILVAGDNINISGSTISADVPTNISELTNDSGYLPESEYDLKVTELENEIAGLQSSKSDKTSTYTKAEVDSKLSSVYKYKGGVENISELNAIVDPEIGDVYDIKDTGDNYVWSGTEWDKLSGIVDLTAYALKTELPTATSDLTNDTNFVADADYTHTDNNFTTVEKNKLASLENYNDVTVVADITALENSQATQDTAIANNTRDIVLLATNKADASDIPTLTSELTNDSGFITDADLPTIVQTTGDSIVDIMSQDAVTDALANKVTIEAGKVLSDNNFADEDKSKLDGISTSTVLFTEQTLTEGQINQVKENLDINDVDIVQETGSLTTSVMSQNAVTASLLLKQNKLIAGDNITIDNSTNTISAAGGSGGTTNYSELTGKPQINGVTLDGNKTTADLLIDIPTATSELTNDSNFVVDASYVHTDNNFTTVEKTKLAGLENYDDTTILADIDALETDKVDKVAGKGLSTNDYTASDKSKVDIISTSGSASLFLNQNGEYAAIASGEAGTLWFPVTSDTSTLPTGSREGDIILNGATSAITVAGTNVPSGSFVTITSASPFVVAISGSIQGTKGDQGVKGDSVVSRTLTEVEYAALTTEEKNNGTLYYIVN